MTKLEVLKALKNGDMFTDLNQLPKVIVVYRRMENANIRIDQTEKGTNVGVVKASGVSLLVGGGKFLTNSVKSLSKEDYSTLKTEIEKIFEQIKSKIEFENVVTKVTDEMLDKLIKESESPKLAELPASQLM